MSKNQLCTEQKLKLKETMTDTDKVWKREKQEIFV